MIYALLSTSTPLAVRQDIARAILAPQTVGPFVQQGYILHVMNAHRGVTYHCIYCLDVVRPTKRNRPRGRVPLNDWYFEHTTEPQCLGTDFGLGNGLVNLQYQGCYIQMGHEAESSGQQTVWRRTCCKTVQSG